MTGRKGEDGIDISLEVELVARWLRVAVRRRPGSSVSCCLDSSVSQPPVSFVARFSVGLGVRVARCPGTSVARFSGRLGVPVPR